MISEALELRVLGRQVSRSWCLCVVSHGYGGFGGGRDDDGMNARQSHGGCSHAGKCRSSSRVRGDAVMTPDHTAVQVRSSGRVEHESVGLPGGRP